MVLHGISLRLWLFMVFPCDCGSPWYFPAIVALHGITKTRLYKYIENFTTKEEKFSEKKKFYIFHIPAQNIDCGYLLEPPRRGGSNGYPQSMFFFSKIRKVIYTPVNPSFTI